MIEPKSLPEQFRNRLPAIIDAIVEIVEIESPSYDESGVIRVADWVAARARESMPECSFERFDAEGYGQHLLIRAFEDLAGDPLLVLGHIDTVHPVGSQEKNPTRVENGKLYGCGTFDMKANIALMLDVFHFMKHNGIKPARPVNILLACDEEVGSETGRPIVERESAKAAYCFVFEPSANGKVKTGRKGTGGYVLRSFGIPAHAGLDPEKGASAILELSRQITVLHGLTDHSAGATVTVGKVKGGTATNVVPAEAECTVDVRFSTMEQAAELERSILGLTPFDERVRLEVEGEVNRPPMERTAAVGDLFEKARGLAASIGYELDETQVGGASDGNFVGALGVPLLDGLGITGNGAHTLDEYVLVDDVPLRGALMTLLLSTDMLNT